MPDAAAHTARLPRTPVDDGVSLRLVHGRLIDGTGAAPVTDAEVVITGDRISYAGAYRAGLADGATVVDLAGRTVLPGFIDAHLHMGSNLEAPLTKQQGAFPSERALDTTINLRRTLMAGVTTARDLGGIDAGFRQAIADGTVLGPRLHLALSALSPTGGHSDYHLANGAQTRGFAVLDPIVDTDDDVRRTTRLLIRSGADVIKVCTSGGVSSPSDQPTDVGVPAEHIKIIREEADKRQGQPVAAHAQGLQGILEAVRGGVSSVEHGYQIDSEAVDLMLSNGTMLVPTLSAALRVPDPALVPGYLYEKKVRWSAIAREHIAKALVLGVKVAMGTDSGVCPHGRNLGELGHLVELGLSPMEAILAGTRNAAELLRLSDQLGTVAEGRLADLVITGVDPLGDIGALADPTSIGAVLQGGRLVKDSYGWFPGSPVVPAISA
ncbi:amidohydrolase family protein [Microlunatus sp. Gsoil 973]|uniref:metal-dependent hydrolase family protein n=1 Tax=Microlunatus sp. Gsoil 973 TaxID=2672569 RepID=UPI0012B4760D|nr:amidohydrolase family protein [Microlunatus sp. Gsoil 973]QGN33517.1 amidohydrolase family protein [Microlunatus sp. Gsoil 973]